MPDYIKIYLKEKSEIKLVKIETQKSRGFTRIKTIWDHLKRKKPAALYDKEIEIFNETLGKFKGFNAFLPICVEENKEIDMEEIKKYIKKLDEMLDTRNAALVLEPVLIEKLGYKNNRNNKALYFLILKDIMNNIKVKKGIKICIVDDGSIYILFLLKMCIDYASAVYIITNRQREFEDYIDKTFYDEGITTIFYVYPLKQIIKCDLVLNLTDKKDKNYNFYDGTVKIIDFYCGKQRAADIMRLRNNIKVYRECIFKSESNIISYLLLEEIFYEKCLEYRELSHGNIEAYYRVDINDFFNRYSIELFKVI